MSIITLTSDFGFKDPYISSIKGEILSRNQSVNIIDIAHEITPFNIKEGFFVLNSCYNKFPKKTIHLFLVNEGGLTDDQDIFAFTIDEYYFITTGKQILALFEKEPDQLVKVEASTPSETFPSITNHIKVALDIIDGSPLEKLGSLEVYTKSSFSSGLITSSNSITGSILYIDNFGNAITNINKSDFEKIRNNRKFEISFSRVRVNKINQAYHETETGDPLCIFNSDGKLELAVSFGNAQRLMGLNVDNKVKIEFFQ